MSTEYYEEVIHQERRTVLLDTAIQQYKKDNPSKKDYAGDLYPRDIIKILMQNQIRLFSFCLIYFFIKRIICDTWFSKK